MRLFNDLFSGCVVSSDAYPHEELFGGAAIRFKAKFITKTDDLGGIPAGEGDEEDGQGETVINLVDTYNLHEVEGYTVKEWMLIVKDVMGKVMKRIKDSGDMAEDEVKAYKKGCVEFVNFIKGQFKDVQLYQGDIGDYDGTAQSFGYALSENQEDPLELSFYFFKGALTDEKY